MALPRQQNPRRLTPFGHKVFSQNDEDGIIAEIFRRIGLASKTFVEFGVGDGLECNTLWLLYQGWEGLWIQGDAASCDKIRATHAPFVEANQLALVNSFVTAENIDRLIAEHAKKPDIDLLSIDIDFNDYWVWQKIETVSPRVVIIEYNATWAPPASITVPYVPNAVWNGTNYFGASLDALCGLARRKGYSLVGCCLSGVNAFFVRDDLLGDNFLDPGSSATHYEPARFPLARLPSGHPPFVGPVVTV